MTFTHYIGASLVLVLITFVGWLSGRRVKSANDFGTGGRSAGAGIVVGAIVGTLVGGASTIGTAQLAFSYGFSAWWFTLGGGISVLVMALFFAKPFYKSEISTLPQIFAREYGDKAATTATLLTSLGSFLSVVSQIISGIALITAISTISHQAATILTVLLMIAYVVFGGVWGAGYVGMLKTTLLCISLVSCGIIAINHVGGIGVFYESLPSSQYFSLIARGAPKDIGAGLSLLVGVLTTQAYIQAVVSAKSLKVSRLGLIISAAVIPIVGVGGIFVGMYMKLNHPEIDAGGALPLFIIDKLPPLFGGAVLATLLVALVGTGAGVTLGLSTMLYNDIYKKYINKKQTDEKGLMITRTIIVCVLVGAALVTIGNVGSMILSWSFLSMGLRGAVAFIPLCTALFLSGKISSKYALAAMIAGPALVIAAKLLMPSAVDPLFYGIAGGFVIAIAGLFAHKKQKGSE